MKKDLLIFFISLFSLISWAQNALKINEVSSNNFEALLDIDGDDPDWIEILNTDSLPIQLKDYYLSDDKDIPRMWQFPDYILNPGEYLIVLASEKNRKNLPHHFETALNGDSSWKYHNPTTNEDYLTWNLPDFNDENWAMGRGGFGVGYDSINTYTNDTVNAIYLRNEFYLSDTSQVMSLFLHAYYDDGFVVYLNGYEILREHMLNNGIKPSHLQTAFPQHYSVIDQGTPPQKFEIEPKIWKSLLKNGRNTIAIENHNYWNNFPLVIKPWISLAMADTIIQTNTLAPTLSTPDFYLHTNFKIRSSGEKIYLVNQQAEIIQSMEIPELRSNHSYGFHPEFPDSLVLFKEITPGNLNSYETFAGYITDSCYLSSSSGFFQDSVLIEIENYHPQYQVYFTLDGHLPSSESFLYDSAFYIDSTVVLRVCYFSDSLLAGSTSNYSYFVNESPQTEVVSIISEPQHFFDEEEGIYTYGDTYWPNLPFFEANFWQDWEKPVYLELMDQNGSLKIHQDAGVKIHGNYTRSLPQKSLGFYAKSKYGTETFEHQIFSERSYQSNSKRFLLRNAGNDNMLAHMRDLLNHRRMAQTKVDIQYGRPALAFINGAYWGLYNLREKVDRFYLADIYGVNPDEVNLLEQNGLIISGDRRPFEDLLFFIENNDLDTHQNYQYVSDEIDIENWSDLLIANLYNNNFDWPHHNTKFWNAPGHKWQQLLVDLDVSMGITSLYDEHANSLDSIHQDEYSYLAIIYRKLLENDDFKRYYINRFADLMNTIFLPEEYMAVYDSLKAEMEPEMQRHCNRWNMNYNNWSNGYLTKNIRDYIEERPEYMRQFLREKYALGSYDIVNLSVSPENKGLIKLNSISIHENNWEGIYFDSIPVRLEAIPNPGFEFVRWESETTPSLADSGRILENYFLKSYDEITAIFFSNTGLEDTLDIAISEINYRKGDFTNTGDWIEIYNRESEDIDISNWTIGGAAKHKRWTLPENVIFPANSYLVLVEDTAAFAKWHPGIPHLGPFQFDLEEVYPEKILLFDELDRLVSKLSFKPMLPWPQTENTLQSIELSDINTDYHLAENWQIGCPGGSPGEAPKDCEIELPIIVTEILYDAHDAFKTGDWLEIYNTGNESIDLSHWLIHDKNAEDKSPLKDHLILNPQEYLVIMQDSLLFFDHYEAEGKWSAPFNFGLSADGDSISLLNAFGQKIIEMAYETQNPWPNLNNKEGFSIELIDTAMDFHEGINWTSACLLGTPWHAPEFCFPASSIKISEIKYNSDPQFETGDWIEIYNNGDSTVDLSQAWIYDSNPDNIQQLPEGLQINPQEFLLLIQDTALFFNIYDSMGNYFGPMNFGLSSSAESFNILNQQRQNIASLSYTNQSPWPENAGSNGWTIELSDMSLNMEEGENWMAHCFAGTPWNFPDGCVQTESIFISELKYSSQPDSITGDWIELFNSNQMEVNLKNWSLIIQGDTLKFEDDFMIEAENYAVLAADLQAFYTFYDENINAIQIDSFDLRKAESIVILDPYRFPGRILNYDHQLNWPVVQNDTNSCTLELVDYSNTYLPQNWRKGCEFGTPGFSPSHCDVTNLNELESSFNFQIKPNPAFNQVYIDININVSSRYQMNIIDYQGSIVQSEDLLLNRIGQHTIPINIARLQSGLYLLQITNGKESVQQKIIKLEE